MAGIEYKYIEGNFVDQMARNTVRRVDSMIFANDHAVPLQHCHGASQRFDFHTLHVELDHDWERCIDGTVGYEVVERSGRNGAGLVVLQSERAHRLMSRAGDARKSTGRGADGGVEPPEAVAVQRCVGLKPFRIF